MFIEENMYMRSLRRKRKITIYVPDDYETSNKRYPVLYINDGQNAFFDETSYMKISWGFYDYVQAQNLDVIMVAIPCNNRLNKREDEYGPWRIGKEILMMEYGDEEMSRIYYESNETIYNELIKKSNRIEGRFFEEAGHNEYEWRQRVPIFMDLFYK